MSRSANSAVLRVLAQGFAGGLVDEMQPRAGRTGSHCAGLLSYQIVFQALPAFGAVVHTILRILA